MFLSSSSLFLVSVGLAAGLVPLTQAADKTPGAPVLTSAKPEDSKKASGLGLPRLKSGNADRLTADKFEIDSLVVPPGAVGVSKQVQRELDFLSINGGSLWSRELRGSARDVVFVAICANGSVGSEFEIGGAMFRVVAGQEPGKAEIVLGVSDQSGAITWRPSGLRCAIGTYGGQQLAELPLLTVRLDPAANEWDLFVGTVRIADDLPLVDETKKNVRRINLRAGLSGAQICGVVVADENPLFADANRNGIEDDFEIAHRGALLSAASSKSDKNDLAKEWRRSQRGSGGTALSVPRPAPDAVALSAPQRRK